MAIEPGQTVIAIIAGLLGGLLSALFLPRQSRPPSPPLLAPASTTPEVEVELARQRGANLASLLAEDARKTLPRRVILVRHGESEGNADHTLYRNKPDNKICLTAQGEQQARVVGARIRTIVGPGERVAIITSPFERTLHTMRCLIEGFESGSGQDGGGSAAIIAEQAIEPRVREQEFGNLQGDDFKALRLQQVRVGRFYYRFPTGESGADVYGRTKEWWDSTVLNLNLRPNVAPVDTLVVVTHGLTMRLILMQLFGWSPNTFHTIWNAGNCDCYVLRKDEGVPGRSPFVLCRESGDTPRSSRLLRVRFADGSVRQLALDDYLSLASPRGRQTEAAKRMLAAQHGLDPSTIASIDFYGPAIEVHEGAELSDVVGVVVDAGEHGLVPTAATSE